MSKSEGTMNILQCDLDKIRAIVADELIKALHQTSPVVTPFGSGIGRLAEEVKPPVQKPQPWIDFVTPSMLEALTSDQLPRYTDLTASQIRQMVWDGKSDTKMPAKPGAGVPGS
jgi:hypothetical protein